MKDDDKIIKRKDAWQKITPTKGTEEVNMWDYTKKSESDDLVGVLRNVEVGVGQFQGIVYTVMTQDLGPVKFWGCAVLNDKLNMVDIGDEVKIIRKGKNVDKDGNEFYDFDVYARDLI